MIDSNFSLKTEVDKPDFGTFIIEPLTQGYGQTLGNSLRRVLLTSLAGAAVTSVKIDGVDHQFSTLPGLKEDVVELLLAIKKIRLRVSGEGPFTMSLSKKGPGVVTAADIEPSAGVTIVNTDLVLGTLSDKKAELNISFTVQKGLGYVTADEQHLTEVGVIPLDALYSPVTRVNYHVESTRVGRMTNLDKLVMDIWTDGTVAPKDALIHAAQIMVSFMKQIYEPQAAHVEEVTTMPPMISDEVTRMRIEELDIPTRIVNALANGGIETIGQLVATPRNELMKIKNLGTKSLGVVEEKLKEKNIVLSL